MSVEERNDGVTGALETHLRTLRQMAEPPAGMEGRVLDGVLRRVRAGEGERWRWRVESWMPVGAAACAVCLLAGGLVVERETVRVPPSAASAVVLGGSAGTSGFATAAARRSTPEPVAVGHRRGRTLRPRKEGAARAGELK